MTDQQLPRGLRNNNPLNIRKSSDKWQGMHADQNDAAFVRFTQARYGFRAALVILRNYRAKYGLKTLSQLIGRWAPPNENNTAVYVSTVCTHSLGKLQASAEVDLYDRGEVTALLSAMTRVENGTMRGLSGLPPELETELKAALDLVPWTRP